jgi:nitrate/TMAO reductase-like tetraheme cytochrome c subunit
MRRSRIALLSAVATVALAAAAMLGWRTYDYVENDPRFCTSCHLMDTAFAKWQVSTHRTVGCHACHVQSFAESLEQLVKYLTLRPTEVARHATVEYARCGACHLSQDERWHQVAETAGHKVHFARLGFECVQCHSRGVHEFVRPSDACSECHAETVRASSGMATLHCTTCHAFLAADHALAHPRRVDCLSCHEHMQVREERFAENAPMRLPCQQCHQPHQRPLPTVAECRHCHRVEGFGLHDAAAHEDCMSCHRPHLWRVDERATCERCHAGREDHYPVLACAGCHAFGNHAEPAARRAAP